jgi:antitoxin component YwqK of YwqJK toxin-antitoxin module
MAEDRDTIFVVEHNMYKKISYFDNGVKKEVGFYNSDKQRVGQWISYHTNGVISSKVLIQYYENKRVGTWVQYKEDGSVLSVRKY